jgi:4-amino-4-deoxy-L-arabinose transferase-like glycosyltransferase
MKKFLKILLRKSNLLVLAIFVIAVFVRFYNFNNRVVYGPEQAISLISAAENLQTPSLLGIPYLLRQTSTGLNLFTSPVFGYTLIPMILLLKYNVIGITAIFALINLLTGLILYFVVKNIFGKVTAIFSSILFLFSDYMIYHSLFIWTSNYMPLIGVATVFLIYKYLKKSDRKIFWVFLLGLVSGIGFGLQYIYLFGIVLLIVLIIWKSKQKLLDLAIFIFGIVIGELPTVIFDLKHNFYHVRTLFAYFLDTLRNPGQSQISYYHLLVLWPVAAIFLGILLSKLYKKYKILTVFVLVTYICLNLISPRSSFNKSYGMPPNLTAQDILKAASIINSNSPKNFNVTVLMDFDNRGYVLRFPLEFVYKKNILGVEDYPNAGSLYVLANNSYDFSKPDIWEISSYQPYKVDLIGNINSSYNIYKLTK